MSNTYWKRRLLSHSLWVALGIFLGRLAGFARESSLAATFGASSSADVAIVLLTVPDVLVNLLVGGALSVVLIPEFKRLGSGIRSQSLFVQSSFFVGLVFAMLAAVASYFALPLLSLVAPGLDSGSRKEAYELLNIVLWAVPLTTLAGISTAYLQANERFLVPALGTFIYNTVLVVAILFLLDATMPLQTLAVAILIAVLLRWLSQLSQLPKCTVSLRSLRWHLLRRTLLKRYLQALGAGGLMTLLPVMGRALASQEGEGSMAIFNYAHKLVEFPLGISITVFSVAVLPLLSQRFARGENTLPIIRVGLNWIVVISLALAMTLMIYSKLFSDMVFGWGRMTADQVTQIALLFSVGLLALPLQGVSSLLVAIFNAKRDTVTPLQISAGAVCMFFPLAWVLGQWFGLKGIMASLVFAYMAMLVVQVVTLYNRHSIAIWRLLSPVRLSLLLLLMAGTALIGLLAKRFLSNELGVQLMASGITGTVLLLLGLYIIGEWQALARWVIRRKPLC